MSKRMTKSIEGVLWPPVINSMINRTFKSEGPLGRNILKFEWHHEDSRKLRRKRERQEAKALRKGKL